MAKAKGEKSTQHIQLWVNLSLFWGGLFALFYSLIFLIFGNAIIRLLTDVPEVIRMAADYLPWVIILPIAAMACFLFDGVFVGLMRASAMRNTMLFSAIMVFFPVWYATEHQENVSLWYALLAFLLARGVSLGVSFFRLGKRHELCCDKERQNT